MSDTQTDTEYQKLLREAYNGEVFGDAFFGTLAGRQPDPDRREKLLTLQTVEARTATSLKRLATKAHVLGGEAEARRTGEDLAQGVDPADWQSFIDGLLKFLPDFLASFERLRDIAGTPVDPALTALVNHERAIERFAELEAAGEPGKSMKPLVDHLRTPA
jgi:hypothetical protein